MAKQSELDRLIAQAKRVAEHREQDAEKEIRKMYKKLLKDLQLFLSDTYLKNAKDDVLTYGILQQKGGYAHFLEELTKQADIVTKEEAKLIKQTVTDVYAVCYDGMNGAVQQSVTDEELAERLKGLKGATPQQVKRAVENPVSGLTLDDTLEKHRKDIIWEIRRQVGIGITQGDRYTTMAKRLAEQYDMSYKKAVRITRTETHRAREAGFNDSANETQDRLIGSGLVMAKTWQTMEDGAVRPNGKKKKTGANHVLMEGQTVLQDEDFELYSDGRKSGDKTPAPSQSGIASQDIHCRCYASRDIMTVEEFEALTGRKLDSKYHKPKTSEKAAETVDIFEDSSIIKTDEMLRKKDGTHRRIGSDGQQIIDQPTYNKLVSEFKNHDGRIIRGIEAKTHLEKSKAYASYLPSFNTIVIRDDATVSDVLEETHHAYQDRVNMFGEVLTAEVRCRREIEAQQYLLSVTDKYKIPKEEVEITQKNLEYYIQELENILKGE